MNKLPAEIKRKISKYNQPSKASVKAKGTKVAATAAEVGDKMKKLGGGMKKNLKHSFTGKRL